MSALAVSHTAISSVCHEQVTTLSKTAVGAVMGAVIAFICCEQVVDYDMGKPPE